MKYTEHVTCPWCEHEITEATPFCAWCGRAQSTDLVAAKAYVDEQLSKRLDTELTQRFHDKDLAALEISERVVERLVTWGKWLVGSVSILLALLGAILFLLGYDQWSKVTKSAENDLSSFASKLQESEKDKIHNQIDTLVNDAVRNTKPDIQREVQQALNKSKPDIQQEVQDASAAQLTDFGKNISALNQQVSTLRSGQPITDLMSNFRSQHRIIGTGISHLNAIGNWSALAADQSFVIIKATTGKAGQDPAFARNMSSCQNTSLICGAYHWFTAADASEQANNLLQVIKPYRDILIAVDVEPTPGGGTLRADQLLSFLRTVQQQTGRQPIIYAGSSWSTLGFGADFAAYPLWIADYHLTSQPKVPQPWTNWKIWQFTDTATVKGVTGSVSLCCDGNVFNGSKAELVALTRPVP